ncbi:MAG TPA: ThuA domain-containing protein [Isosphaeraceae bacterium]
MPHRRLAALAILALAATAPTPALAQKKNPTGVPVLILSGGQRQHHGYREQALGLSRTLEDTGRYRVTICEDAAILETPALVKYEILVLTADRRDDEFKFTEKQQHRLLDYVKDGHGFVSIHGADNGAKDWLPEWRTMLGGVFSHVGLPDSKTKKGKFTVKVADTGHPINRGISDFPLEDELYYQIQMEPNVEPLLTIDHDGGTWPVAWTRTYWKGRVFHTPLGHRDFGPDKKDPLQDANLSKVLVQGIDWVAGK